MGFLTVSPSGGLQQRLLGLQLGQLSAEAVHLVLQLLVVLNDVYHLLVGLLLAAGRAVPAEEHPCDGEMATWEEKTNQVSQFVIGGLGDDCYFRSSLEGKEASRPHLPFICF